MFRINQLEQENIFLFQQHMECQNTLLLWMEDHKRVTVENQDLSRQLKDKQKKFQFLVEGNKIYMDRVHEKEDQQEEKSKILEAELIMKDEMLARMMEEMSIQKQETERLARQNQSMMMMMQAEAEEQAQSEADERDEQVEKMRDTQEQLKRSEEARGALKGEMEKLKELLLKREGEQRKSAQYSIIGTENLKKFREKITRESERIREKLEARKQSTASQSTERVKKRSIMTLNITSEEEKNPREEREEETREYIKREEEKETEEERVENEEEYKSDNAKREDDVEVIDEARSMCNEENEGKTVYRVDIGVKTNLGGMNGSNIGAKEREKMGATEIRSGREKESKTETWK